MLLNADAKRLAIFAYYDAEGIVDDYVIYLLKAVQAQCETQIVVVNGTLTDEAKARVEKHCTRIVFRENAGYDITAYKDALLSEQENLSTYDEILFYNQTIFGPVYPLAEMFEAMAQRDVDFWGITRHKGARFSVWDNTSFAPHVQSYFFCVRKALFTDERFMDYWKNLPKIETYWDAVSKHEVIFTETFAQMGFAWDVYVNTEDLEIYNDYPLMGMPAGILRATRCPFFKRKSFLCTRHEYANVTQGEATQALYDFIRTQTDYPVRYITQNILRTVDIATVTSALTMYCDITATAPKTDGIAAVLWIASDALAEMLCNTIMSKTYARVFAVFATEELREKYMPLLPADAKSAVTQENGAQYLFRTLFGELSAYEYVLYLHNSLPLLLNEFVDATTIQISAESLVADACAAILHAREDIGVMIAPPVMHQDCFAAGQNWPQLAPKIADSLKQAGIEVPLGETKPGLAVRGGMFFARKSAIAPLCRYPFTESTFSGIYPAWEYLVPLAVQSSGCLVATACSVITAYSCLANETALLREITAQWTTPGKPRYDQMRFRMQAILDFYHERRHQMTLEQAFRAKLTLKQKLWICAQIFLKPETFARLHKGGAAVEPPVDELD